MREISGFCERCDVFSPFLEKEEGSWLCTVCYDEMTKMEKILVPVFPFYIKKDKWC